MTQKPNAFSCEHRSLSRGDIVLFHFPVSEPDPVLDLPSPCVVGDQWIVDGQQFVQLFRGVPTLPNDLWHRRSNHLKVGAPVWQHRGLAFRFDTSFPIIVSVHNRLFTRTGRSAVIGQVALPQHVAPVRQFAARRGDLQ